jgi:hypothetical protein
MKALLCIFCLALLLAGCQASPQAGFFQTRIPPPGTLPPGTLLASNSYNPAAMLPAVLPADSFPAASPATPPARTETFVPVERRGATLSRVPLASSGPILAATGREEPIRIAENSPLPSGLAAVVPIRGMPTTDLTGFFQTVRAGLSRPANNLPSAISKEYIEISQLPDPPGGSRRASLTSQPLR